ncbi:5-methyltetrahydropteroyltriglutamate--homocysteine S-methyltransferase [Pectinatus sottacetonis]|uniref:5-methyltetrahydropteroyltriglutamate-- homocysteine S-methyltransferase n=1 Tax=Pectinatus sottacetonis TaxID=1002795 RepID=UPI001E46D623|nr:5-methyltetrahydropteroyltriglutamate--homocysteine S-methyltransferase [Pectinatus sottacetonis]
MMKTSIIGFPRIGAHRELKFAVEKYLKKQLSLNELVEEGKQIRKKNWLLQKDNDIDIIPSNDFSFYDGMLDTAVMLNVVPKRYKMLGLNDIDEYFAMARGYQNDAGDVKALMMKKWFNTNYHYMVPEFNDDTEIKLAAEKPLNEFREAQALGIKTKPVIVGPFTFLKLANFTGQKKMIDFADSIKKAYIDLLDKFSQLGPEWVQLDEPVLVTDLTVEEISLFVDIYRDVLKEKHGIKILCQTYFGDIRDCYETIKKLSFDGVGIDFVEGKNSLSLIEKNGFDADKVLFAGIINGKNIWRNHYKKTIGYIDELKKYAANIVLNTSCSLLHVPVTLENEHNIDAYKKYFSFAVEKLHELKELKIILRDTVFADTEEYKNNVELFKTQRYIPNKEVQSKIADLSDTDFERLPVRSEREKIQKREFNLPVLPTTTIGSFPQTKEVRDNRFAFRKKQINKEAYIKQNKKFIADCIQLQEEIGLDVLVHGEFERNDMVEYFGENLEGYIFTENAWVQSYGTRCVKPPVIWGDISRRQPITVDYITYAQSCTKKLVKGMLTGPITILNWSFPREDISLQESAFQIGLAIRDEVLDLEANGIKIIQIDEAALREKLPLRKADWHSEYLDWAIRAFKLVHSGVSAETQIHTHMCYSEFNDIIKDIDNMDADVITFEASRSDFTVVDALNAANFATEVGPGVYDIHSPRVPSVEEIENEIIGMLKKIPIDKLWINPDCGLKTRGVTETKASLKNLVCAVKNVRGRI